ncbi:MAG: hypothetical protein ACYDGY_03145 [Acidimicrobiales bacterium]
MTAENTKEMDVKRTVAWKAFDGLETGGKSVGNMTAATRLPGGHTQKHGIARRLGMALLPLVAATVALMASALSAGPAFAQSSSSCPTSAGSVCFTFTNGSITVTLGTIKIPLTGLGGYMNGTYYTNGQIGFPPSGAHFNPVVDPTLMGVKVTGTGTLELAATGTANFNESTGAISNLTLPTNIVMNTTAPIALSNCALPFTVTGLGGTATNGSGTISGTTTVSIASFESEVKTACPTVSSLLATAGSSVPSTGTATVVTSLPFTMAPLHPTAVAGSPSGTTTSTTTTTTTTPSTTSAVTTPATSTGKPWSGWTWWLLDALVAMAGASLLFTVGLRRRHRVAHARQS